MHVTLRKHSIYGKGGYIHYDDVYRLYIQVSTMYRNTGKLCGLCGNYDGNQNNDPTTATELQCLGGKIEKRNVVYEWKADNAEAQNICNQGVFSVCNQIMDPQLFINDCVLILITVMVIQKRDKIVFAMQWPTMLVLVLIMVHNHQIGGGELESCRKLV